MHAVVFAYEVGLVTPGGGALDGLGSDPPS
jgi:hypothetical protein